MFVVCINCSLFVNAVEIFTGPNDNKIPASTMIIVADILKKIQTQISDRFCRNRHRDDRYRYCFKMEACGMRSFIS